MWKDYLSFSRSEQKGIVVLIALIFIMVAFRVLFPLFIPATENVTVKLDSLYFTYLPKALLNSPVKVPENYEIAEFDPNNITSDFLISIGINSRIANNWQNYILKGGFFSTPEEIMKLYGMDSSLFKQLLPFMKIKKVPLTVQNKNFTNNEKIVDNRWNIDSLLAPINSEQSRFQKKSFVPNFIIEINSADTTEWMLLKGIGPVLSKRIINYKNRLGGFASYYQLLEVYGIQPDVVENNKNFMIVDTTLIVPLNINTASISKLREHPYLDFYKAQSIIEKRKVKNFTNIEEVLALENFSEVNWEILKHYLSVE